MMVMTMRRKYKGRNRHHMINRMYNGPSAEWNLLLLKIERHNMLHYIFGNRNLEEIISVLKRVLRAKNRQK